MNNRKHRLVVYVLWLIAGLAVSGMAFTESQSSPPVSAPKVDAQPAHEVPVLTTEQKLEIRDLQAKEGEVVTAILQLQMQATQRMQQLSDQKRGYEDQLNRIVAGLCVSKDGKKYQFNPSDLTCTPEPPKSEKK